MEYEFKFYGEKLKDLRDARKLRKATYTGRKI